MFIEEVLPVIRPGLMESILQEGSWVSPPEKRCAVRHRFCFEVLLMVYCYMNIFVSKNVIDSLEISWVDLKFSIVSFVCIGSNG